MNGIFHCQYNHLEIWRIDFLYKFLERAVDFLLFESYFEFNLE